jgi:hypothetical protein
MKRQDCILSTLDDRRPTPQLCSRPEHLLAGCAPSLLHPAVHNTHRVMHLQRLSVRIQRRRRATPATFNTSVLCCGSNTIDVTHRDQGDKFGNTEHKARVSLCFTKRAWKNACARIRHRHYRKTSTASPSSMKNAALATSF